MNVVSEWGRTWGDSNDIHLSEISNGPPRRQIRPKSEQALKFEAHEESPPSAHGSSVSELESL
jgi:hypothetical protein